MDWNALITDFDPPADLVEALPRLVPEGRLLPVFSSRTNRAAYLAATPDGALYTLRRRGGEWYATERSCPGENPNVPIRHDGHDTGQSLARLIAVAFLGPPPFEGAEAAYKGDRPTAETVYWESPGDRMRRENTNAGSTERTATHVNISNGVTATILERFSEDVRKHGITYVIDCLLRDKLGLDHLPTPHERKARKKPGTKSAAVLLLARRHPEMTVPEIADETDTTPAYARRVLDKNCVRLRDLRTRKRRERTIAEAQRRSRNQNILLDARSGLFSLRELSERYSISEQEIQTLLGKHSVSLAEAKARARGEL